MHPVLETMYRGRPLVFGHRGARAYAPMNTLPSFELAADQGADGIELDVQLSKDGYPVVLHDFTVDDTTDGRGEVRDLTLAQLKALDAGYRFSELFRGTRIPLLDEVFEAVGHSVYVNVELKAPYCDAEGRDEPTGLEKAVAECIVGHRMTGRVIVSCFNPPSLRRFREALPEVPLGFLYKRNSPVDTPGLMKDIPYDAYHPHYSLLSRREADIHHSAGRFINVWTVNRSSEASLLVSYGADGIITDNPDRIVGALKS
jgi:glycerophosphoryl diester phosphodiesterase